MNKKIEELATQAGLKLEDLPDDVFVPLEKFAELIVKECAGIADKEYNVPGCGYITKTKGMRIKEHFGVEE